jgi:hypothetical protein
MERLLRILYTTRGLVLAGTLMLAIAGCYLDQQSAAPIAGLNSHLGSQVPAGPSGQATSQWRIGDPCPPVSTPASAPPCWSTPDIATFVPAQSLCTPSLLVVAPDIACDDR